MGTRKDVLRVKGLVVLSFLGAIMFVLKLAMAGLPNIEPVSLLVIIYAMILGRWALCPVYLYVAMEIFFFGLNLWSVSYLYVWPLLALAAYLLRKMDSPLGWAVLSGGFGLSFGALCALPYVVLDGGAFALAWWVQGIPMDILHCAGNFMLALTLVRPLRALLAQLCVGLVRHG